MTNQGVVLTVIDPKKTVNVISVGFKCETRNNCCSFNKECLSRSVTGESTATKASVTSVRGGGEKAWVQIFTFNPLILLSVHVSQKK